MPVKIFAFADWYLPGRKGGGAVTALANLVELLGDEFDFYVFTRDRDSQDKHAWVAPRCSIPLISRSVTCGDASGKSRLTWSTLGVSFRG